MESYRWNYPLEYSHCVDMAEDQNIELGRWEEHSNGTKILSPLDTENWQHRQDLLRRHVMGELTASDLVHSFHCQTPRGTRWAGH